MKKILLICSEPFDTTWAYYSIAILKALSSKNVKLYFVFFEGNLAFEKGIPSSVETYKVKRRKNKFLHVVQKLYPFDLKKVVVSLLRKEPSIEITHFLTPDYTATPIFPWLKKRTKLIYTVHDLEPHDYKLRDFREEMFVRFMYSRVRKNILYSPILATNSNQQIQVIRERFPEKVSCFFPMPNHIVDSIANGGDVCPELKYISKPFILFFGSIHLYKGINVLVDAFQKSSVREKFMLVIAGHGSFNPLEGISDNSILHINRHIADSEVKNLFESARCVVYPYTSITQTAVIQFPYFFGTPVIASDLGYFQDCIIDGKTGFLFKTGDFEDLACCLEKVCTLNGDVEKMKNAQREQFKRCYSIDALGDSLIQMYDEMKTLC